MKNLFRNLFSIRQKRRAPPAGPVPPVGALIVRADVRMTVTDPIPKDLWNWMLLSGWRALPVKVDRRKCKVAPADGLRELICASATQRDAVHGKLISRASAAD